MCIRDSNFNDQQTQDDWLAMIEYWKPFMVTCTFPCTPHSPMQELNRAQGLGEQVDEIVADAEPLLKFTRKVLDAQARGGRIGVAENPWPSSAWKHKEIYPLYAYPESVYELVRLDQRAYGLEDYQGQLIKKPTGMLVPKDSCLPWWLHKLCDGRHSHAQTVGRGRGYLQAAGA